MLFKRITNQQVIDFLLGYKAKSAGGLQFDFSKVSHLITNDVDLYLLTLIAKAEQQGLEIAFVDPDALQQTASDNIIVGTYIDLSPLMFTGYSFTYVDEDYADFNCAFIMDTQSLISNTFNHFVADSQNDYVKRVRTINNLTIDLNHSLQQDSILAKLYRAIVSCRWFIIVAFIVWLAFTIGTTPAVINIVIWISIWFVYTNVKRLIT